MRQGDSHASVQSIFFHQTPAPPNQVELVPEAEVARRFDIAEIRNMAGKTQSGQKIIFTIWAYAGQDVFYALHHIFLTREGDLLIKREKAVQYLSFWLNSIKLHAPTAPNILVGTHYDEASIDVNEVDDILVKYLSNAGLKKDFAVLRKRGIATLSLLRFLWNDEEVDYLREFMHESMLMSNWAFPEEALTRGRQDETIFFVSSLLKNSTDRKLEQDIASVQSGLTCVLDFSEFFLPDGVFTRLLSLCAKHSGDLSTRWGAPRLAGHQAVIGSDLSTFALEERDNYIRLIMIPGTEAPASTIKTLISMFLGARDAVFKDLPWQLLLQSPRNPRAQVKYDESVKTREAKSRVVASVGVTNASVADFDPFFEDGSLFEDHKDTGSVEQANIPLAAGLKYHIVLSHRQYDADDACNLMANKLRNRGLRVWIDQEAEGNLAEDEMKQGIRELKFYLLFLSKTVFEGAVIMKLETARPILVVHESDPNRPGFANFPAYIDAAPASAKHLFKEKESMSFQRRRYLAEAFYKELIERIRIAR
ncbi:Leucine-rich repeat serine/threonine-protein kinase 2 [Hondaea fermentalgiana]|uniref:Leucine-rich repeat serine/threonine-protein kinase 2 n=1 Tax=Hondaea fermentalgiana TaxID=2315210 RepID=A0A2R5GTV0_9STRA|nr:Leucine-rich repeat serine/threonine-protein kinase 2 [Hondaea fermentalgiana]|eukprot:GBG33995.1 Leucine-rich repeat serine/threonine-protein kinase 2 [Hondaea fermentalgiana]